MITADNRIQSESIRQCLLHDANKLKEPVNVIDFLREGFLEQTFEIRIYVLCQSILIYVIALL